jgi:ABC-type antimicrobial peptide transport system permease subunit
MSAIDEKVNEIRRQVILIVVIIFLLGLIAGVIL